MPFLKVVLWHWFCFLVYSKKKKHFMPGFGIFANLCFILLTVEHMRGLEGCFFPLFLLNSQLVVFQLFLNIYLKRQSNQIKNGTQFQILAGLWYRKIKVIYGRILSKSFANLLTHNVNLSYLQFQHEIYSEFQVHLFIVATKSFLNFNKICWEFQENRM